MKWTNVRFSMTRLVALASFLFVFGLVGCDADPATTDAESLDPAELNELAATLATDLDLSADQARAVDDLLGGDEKPAPGHLWTVAADLQETLTDAQKARLLERAGQRRARFSEEGRPGHFRRGGEGREDGPRGSRRSGAGQAREAPGSLGGILTDEQQEQFKALREAHRAQVQALRQDDSLTPEARRAQAEALREEMKAALDALLTDEQKAEMEQRREERQARSAERKEQAEQARAEALDLTAQQETDWEALREAHRAEHTALFEQVRAGTLDRAAVRAQMQERRDTHRAELATILTADQMEIVEIHQALQGEVGRRHGRRPGSRGFGPGSHGGPRN